MYSYVSRWEELADECSKQPDIHSGDDSCKIGVEREARKSAVLSECEVNNVDLHLRIFEDEE